MKSPISILFLLFTTLCFAQIPVPDQVEEAKIKQAPTVKVNALGFGMGMELHTAKNQSIYGEFGCSFVIDATNGYNAAGQQTTVYTLVPLPYASLEYRYYYNMDKRKYSSKNVDAFCSNYTGAFVRRVRISRYDIDFWNFAPTWGMQRRFWNFLYFDAQIGPSIYLAQGESLILPHVKFGMGLSLQYGQ